jgi:hypothetical protein
MKQKKSCSNCIKGTPLPINNDVFCREKGIVSPDYSCFKHRFMPEPKSFKEMNYKCIDCQNFIVNIRLSDISRSIGLCQLFSVRQFDGQHKNACSKFVKKSALEVS